MIDIKLEDPISSIKGVGLKTQQAINKLGIFTCQDLLFYLPRRYDDFSNITDINKIIPGNVTLKAKITNLTSRRSRSGLSITEGIATDQTGSVRLVWFNQIYRQASINPQEIYYISGNYKLTKTKFSIINPSIETVKEVTVSNARIVPIYRESKNINSGQLRKIIIAILPLANNLTETLPQSIIDGMGLLKINLAVQNIHYPKSFSEIEKAQQRFQFEELFPILLANELSKKAIAKQNSLKVNFNLNLARQFVAKLPFTLTDDQRRVIWQIYIDMQKNKPMNRLVEGDVGSGKTVVAVMAAVMAQSAGFKVAFMAPTELLAKQHAKTIYNLLKPLGLEASLILLTGSQKISAKNKAIELANKINNSFVVGTHSLLTSGVDWHNLALIIIDEQHRFGVDQRMILQQKAGHLPHFLSITATPIPRSLALTIFNDLKLSRLETMPKDRKEIISQLVYPSSFNDYLSKLKSELNKGRQIYVVCPYIHQKNKMDKQAAEYVHKQYAELFKDYQVGLLHGQLAGDDQQDIMSKFIANKIQILVATTIIEVGVDVANASVMVINGPERFGLAQLHQLRGRVGRGRYSSYCYLILNDSKNILPRLRQFILISDGFKLSELDLKTRGPGEIYGKLQHGKNISFQLTLDNQQLINKTLQGVKLFFNNKENMLKYTKLNQRVEEAQRITNLN